MTESRRLGRGLEALLGPITKDEILRVLAPRGGVVRLDDVGERLMLEALEGCPTELAKPSEELERLRQKHLDVEAVPSRIALDEASSREAHHQRSALQMLHLASDLHIVRRGVVLHLLAWLEVVSTSSDLWLEADLCFSAEAGERRVGHV